MSAFDVLPNDPQAITAEIVAAYEAATGKTLYPAQVERLLIDLIAYRETLLRAAINDAARQNLVRFARAPMLDYLGELVGVRRLPGEDDERLRARILEAPESFSVAGPRLAYRHPCHERRRIHRRCRSGQPIARHRAHPSAHG